MMCSTEWMRVVAHVAFVFIHSLASNQFTVNRAMTHRDKTHHSSGHKQDIHGQNFLQVRFSTGRRMTTTQKPTAACLQRNDEWRNRKGIIVQKVYDLLLVLTPFKPP